MISVLCCCCQVHGHEALGCSPPLPDSPSTTSGGDARQPEPEPEAGRRDGRDPGGSVEWLWAADLPREDLRALLRAHAASLLELHLLVGTAAGPAQPPPKTRYKRKHTDTDTG